MPGDAGLRHDIQLLADRGVLRGPVTTWPLSWADVAREVLDYRPDDRATADVKAALLRVQRVARRMMRTNEISLHARVAVGGDPNPLRTFSDTPREETELQMGADWTGVRFAARLQMTRAESPQDGKSWRPDGSYVGVNLMNFMVSAGYMDRWWGPGWEGSMILSNSARPIPAISLERNYSDAFKSRWLRWIGPWRASIMLGQLENTRTDFDRTRLLAMRVSFKPLPQLEIGLSRAAQWCGEGRPCDRTTFFDLLIGNDNDQAFGDQPGNQLGGYDLRWAFRALPLALYGQAIGEDEAGGLPSKPLGLLGAESWGNVRWGQWRLHAEVGISSCEFTRSTPDYDCAYGHNIYTQGYRFRGRSIGHAMDSDGRMYSLGGLLMDRHGHGWELLVRKVELNRDATSPESAHTLAPLAVKLANLEIAHVRESRFGRLHFGVSLDDFSRNPDGPSSEVRGFIQWSNSL